MSDLTIDWFIPILFLMIDDEKISADYHEHFLS